MSECDHDIEYGQIADDFQKNVMQMRCTKCDYQSYSVLRPSELKGATDER